MFVFSRVNICLLQIYRREYEQCSDIRHDVYVVYLYVHCT